MMDQQQQLQTLPPVALSGINHSPSKMDNDGSPSTLFRRKPNEDAPRLLPKMLSEYYSERFEKKAEPLQPKFSKSRIFYAPASEFALLRHELACLDNILVKARIEWNSERKVLNKRWDEVNEEHQRIYDSIPHFNGSYVSSFAKRDRAMKQEIREREQCEEKDREIRRLSKEKEKLEDIKAEQDNRLEKFSIFKMYLEQVKATSQGEYGDIREIMDRYTMLANARNNLKTRTDSIRESVQRRQNALERDILMKSNEVLAYRNFLSELMDYQNSLHEQVIRLEDNLIRIKTTSAQRTLIIGQIKMAIQNLYLQVCKHMHRSATLDDTLGQLLDIRISVREMFKLAKDIKHMLRNAYLTAEAEAAAREKLRRKNSERRRRLERLGKRGKVDPRELFGLRKRASEATGKKMLFGFGVQPLQPQQQKPWEEDAVRPVINQTVEKAIESSGGVIPVMVESGNAMGEVGGSNPGGGDTIQMSGTVQRASVVPTRTATVAGSVVAK